MSRFGVRFLGSSVYGNVTMGKVAAERLYDLDAENSGNYVVPASNYAVAGLRDCATDMRKVKKLQKHLRTFFFSTNKQGSDRNRELSLINQS
ncbi:hypothetical protein OSB04_007810 [Centaurea solstitialis]|uniref:Uncharacterized protein n=1 Tax=Centaurea solstitialis TaxID=347529 RepID=A0AA38TKK2_9ASTR|nr:hypothetical protein OSB04_007810 [Centaurea solstitialis]